MPRYLLHDRNGKPVMIAEAATRADAEAHGRRTITGYSGLHEVETPDPADAELNTALAEAFAAMGLSESASTEAARGRDGGHDGTLNQQLAESFRAIGLPDAVAESAARGRESAAAIKRNEAREIPIVTVPASGTTRAPIVETPRGVRSGEIVTLSESSGRGEIVQLQESADSAIAGRIVGRINS